MAYIETPWGFPAKEVIRYGDKQDLIWERDLATGEYTLTTILSPKMQSKHFNCKRCGAVGQHGLCEYCGSAE